MTGILDLDSLRNGSPGAAGRFLEASSQLGAEFIPRREISERNRLRIQGNIPALAGYRRLFATRRVWVEGCLKLPETLFCTTWLRPYLIGSNTLLAGDAVNLPRSFVNSEHLSQGPFRRFDRALVIGGRGGAIYGHWLLDFLPQLLTARHCLQEHGFSELPIIVVNSTPYCRELLDRAGVLERCFFPGRGKTVQVGQAFLPLLTKLGSRYAVKPLRESFNTIRQQVRDNPATDRAPAGAAAAGLPQAGHAPGSNEPCASTATHARSGRLIVDRAKAPRSANFDTLLASLQRRGFEKLVPETRPFARQVTDFHSAELIVGEDGSALHNAGFSQRGTSLVVLSRGDKVNYWHGAVACAAGLKLVYLQSAPGAGGAGEYRVDVTAVEDLMTRYRGLAPVDKAIRFLRNRVSRTAS